MEVYVAGLELKLRLSVWSIGSLLVLRDETEVCSSGCGCTSGCQLTCAGWRHDPPAASDKTRVGFEDNDVLQVKPTAYAASVIVGDGHDHRVNAGSRVRMCSCTSPAAVSFCHDAIRSRVVIPIDRANVSVLCAHIGEVCRHGN